MAHYVHTVNLERARVVYIAQPHHFWSPVLSNISTTYVTTDEVTTVVNQARPLLSTVIGFW